VLTSYEKKEAKGAKYFGPEWGVPDKGLGPSALVATYRGAYFIVKDGVYVPEVYIDTTRAHQAMEDISEWLGFESIDFYHIALAKEKENIFKRARGK